MFETIYLEKEIQQEAKPLLARFFPKRIIEIERYTEIFNRKGQNFRLQKEKPALILAKKYGSFLHPIPEKFGIGGKDNFYFSHLLNCPFDCEYCYLQGSLRSSYFVHFINYRDFQKAIDEKPKGSHFFSGYDADSLALEPKTQFLAQFLPFFEARPHYLLEVRTKSIYLLPFSRKPIPNVVIAYTLSPKEIASTYEHKAPPLSKRLEAIKKLQEKGWKIGLRFDPLIYQENYREIYEPFFDQVLELVKNPHSITLGTFRLPKSYYKNMQKIKASPSLLKQLTQDGQEMSYEKSGEMMAFSKKQILKHVKQNVLFTI